MILKIALMVNANNTSIKELDLKEGLMTSRKVDSTCLIDESINLLLYDSSPTDDLPEITRLQKNESKFYPIIPIQTLNLDKDTFEMMQKDELLETYHKASTRWVLNNNIKTIEQLYPTIAYLKDLWIKDRNSFFEELWFILKTNLASIELNLIFHDLKELTKKQEEKGEKAKLCYSYISGEKLPHLFEGKEKETLLMKEYENDFNDFFNITEYSKEKRQLIACAKIDLGPILILAELPSFNQLQQSILIALFTGLQES